MADNCSILEPWSVLSGVGGGHWRPDVLARESEALTRALQASLSEPKGPDFVARESDVMAAALQASLSLPNINTTTNNNNNSYQPHHQDLSSYLSCPSDLYSSPSSQLLASPTTPSSAPLFAKSELLAVAPPAAASDSDSPTTAKKGRAGGVSTGRVSKRRPSRASKRSPTTFISADPANFRQMVQQVTGVQIPLLGGGSGCHLSTAPLLSRPEPLRAGAAAYQGHVFPSRSACLPTLDTSAFLLDQVPPFDPSAAAAPSSSTPSPTPPPVTTTSVAFSSGGLDMGLPCFPTLESSWEVM